MYFNIKIWNNQSLLFLFYIEFSLELLIFLFFKFHTYNIHFFTFFSTAIFSATFFLAVDSGVAEKRKKVI